MKLGQNALARKGNMSEAKETYTQKLNRVAAEAVKGHIGGNKDHGWGNADSAGVIDVLIAESVDEIVAAKGAPPELMAIITGFINPSAVRQKLESAKMLNKSEGRSRGGQAGWMDALK